MRTTKTTTMHLTQRRYALARAAYEIASPPPIARRRSLVLMPRTRCGPRQICLRGRCARHRVDDSAISAATRRGDDGR